jgi:HK97 gp10 family phage protein
MASFSFLDLEKELDKFGDKILVNREKALDEASDYVMGQLKNNTPVRTGKTKESWERSTKYKGVRYINNTAVNKNEIPIINLLEFSRKGHPFARKTFDACLPQVENIFKNNIEKGE